MNSGILWKEWISLRFVETSSDGKKALTDLVLGFIKACRTDLMLRCEASGGRPVPEVSWWNGTQQVETSSSQEDSGGIIIIIIITIKSCSMIMMILTMTDLGFLGQAGGTREWDRSCRQWDQPKAVKVAIIMMILIMMMMMKMMMMMMMMMIFQVRSREADLVQGSEFGHHGLFSNLSPFHLLLLLPSFPHSDYYAQTPMVSRLQMMLNVSPRELIMSPGESLTIIMSPGESLTRTYLKIYFLLWPYISSCPNKYIIGGNTKIYFKAQYLLVPYLDGSS